jgi:hypothetical protein
VYVEGVPPLLGATTVTVTCESPATAVGVPGVPGADSEICAVTADVPTSDCATLFTVLVPVTTVRKYFPASLAPATYVADVAPAMSEQLVAPESVQRCHLYVFTISTAWSVNVTAEVKVAPDPADPVGALVPETTGVYDLAGIPLQDEPARKFKTLAPLVALTYGLKEVLNQSVAEYEPLFPETPGIVTYVVPSKEYSHLSGIPSPVPNVAEKLTEALVTTPLLELQLVLMLVELAFATGIP